MLVALESRRRDALVEDAHKEFRITRQDQTAGTIDPYRVALELLAADDNDPEQWARVTDPKCLRCLAKDYFAIRLDEMNEDTDR